MRVPVSSPTALPTTKAMASASVSRTTLVVVVRRSALCNISCAEFMDEGGKLLGLGLAGKNGDASAVAHAQAREQSSR